MNSTSLRSECGDLGPALQRTPLNKSKKQEEHESSKSKRKRKTDCCSVSNRWHADKHVGTTHASSNFLILLLKQHQWANCSLAFQDSTGFYCHMHSNKAHGDIKIYWIKCAVFSIRGYNIIIYMTVHVKTKEGVYF